MKAQAIVASSLLISAGVSFNAITNYFSDSTNIDWSNPGGWFSLFNMLVLAALLFLALIALERINAETTRLVKKLDMVGYVRSLARPFVHPFSF
jgi:4-hydroxybenzoate polyprenyltransferase